LCGADLADAADLGVSRSFQQEEIPAAVAERVQHDLHQARCASGKTHVAPGSALPAGPGFRALAVYLMVFQHVPVERCRQLIADVAGAAVPEGFIHSCLARAASLAGEVVTLIRALITASAVAGFDETTLRSGPAGRRNTCTARSPNSTRRSGSAPAAWTPCRTPGSSPVSPGSGPPRHPQLHRHRPQARPQRHGRPVRPHARHALAAPGTGTLPVTQPNPRYPSLHVHG
jgi:hypothetical protein